MHRTPYALVIVPLVTIALASPGAALHCNGDITTLDTPAGTFYIDDRTDEVGETDHWIYQEDNGIEGLQSGNFVYPVEPRYCQIAYSICYDRCDHPNPDMRIL